MLVYKTGYEDDPFYPVFSHPDWLYPEERPLRNFPLMLDIETTNACDFRCVFCARQLMRRKPGFMGMDIYRKIVDETAHEGSPFLRIHGWGEPLLHPDCLRHAEYAARKGVTTRFTTNGLAFLRNPGLIDDLILAGAGELLISMQGVDKPSYEKMRKPNTFENFLRVVETVADAKQRRNAGRPFLSIITSVFAEDYTQEKIAAFEDRFLPFADKLGVDFTHMTFLEDHMDVSEWEGGYLFEKKRRPCIEVLIKTHINSDGDVLFCGNDYDGQAHRIGNLADMGVKEAWNSEKLAAWRSVVRNVENHEKLTFCKHCFEFTTKYDALKKQVRGTEE